MRPLIWMFVVFTGAVAAGCDSGGRTALPTRASPAIAVQHTEDHEITLQVVLQDLVGRKVRVSMADEGGPSAEWTFEATEPRQAQIIERNVMDDSVELMVMLSTSGAPGSGEENIHLSGTLRLVYRMEGGQWTLQRIENIAFRYTERVMI